MKYKQWTNKLDCDWSGYRTHFLLDISPDKRMDIIPSYQYVYHEKSNGSSGGLRHFDPRTFEQSLNIQFKIKHHQL